MSFKKLKRSIEQMPRCAYIFLKYLLILAVAMLSASLALYLTPAPDALRRLHLAVLLSETPAGILLLGVIGLALLLDRRS